MQFTFDLISDLHVDTWTTAFDWSGLATSSICVVAGDVARDRRTIFNTLQHLGQCYQAVFYIDGNNEHAGFAADLDSSYVEFSNKLSKIPNVIYLQDNVAVVNGVAILGTNGWWGFDFDLGVSAEQSMIWYGEKESLDTAQLRQIQQRSVEDAAYLMSSVKRLQTHNDIKKIVMVTHTVPDPALIDHDIDLTGHLKFNTMGNRYMMQAIASDTENKISTWCFGHYYGSVDQVRRGIQFVNNCRGKQNSPYSTSVYHPKRIVVEY
jgi:hypothetical protein